MSVENLPTLGLPFLIMTLERMLALLALYKVFIICYVFHQSSSNFFDWDSLYARLNSNYEA